MVTINPIPAEVAKGTALTVSGKTNSGKGVEVIVNVLAGKFGATVKGDENSATFLTAKAVTEEDGTFEAKSKWTEIFIYPGYTFKAMDALITNFHLPESTLVMLVSAFAGKEHVLDAYAKAVREKYRFFSFGDAMFIG